MSRRGERSAWLAWTFGILSAGVVAGLVWLAWPVLPAVVNAAGDTLGGQSAEAGDEENLSEGPADCRRLYSDALWAGLSWEPGSDLVEDRSGPAVTAGDLVDSVAPEVRFTCTWTSETGTIVTTLADAGTDAGELAQSMLPGLGYGCATVTDDRMRCTRAEGDVFETLELGDGRWLSTVETAWHPERYASRVAEAVWRD
ncbi:hypothetical protein QNO21_01625 [Microbacterium sp. zg-Y818]|uniref:hypothetical protein n=1 Tax=unclassified Microbacterium TaxID=2609290 RepID=UPI00214B5EFA|nr:MULTISPECIES: hypothetical protein [unclassified Microbacterium]MCR2802219.1 hypothetical protein [Microbacterium sp. zg.Y818]WIM22762.1 hypothetical protein QNO21_01625 [Microbacterium sp. zg-Y818]